MALIILLVACWHLMAATKIYLKAWFAQALLEQAWDRTLAGEKAVSPWPWADTWPVAELQVPSLDLSQIVLSGDSGRVLAFAPGHTEASAVAGQQGLTMISGHRDTHFRFLEHLEVNDSLIVKTPEASLSYTVVEHGVVDQRSFFPQVDQPEHTLMLITCYPFDALSPGGDLRYIVVAQQDIKSG